VYNIFLLRATTITVGSHMGCKCRNHNKWYIYHLHQCVILFVCVYVGMYIQASLILHHSALMQLENLHLSQNYATIFGLTQSVAMLIDSRRLAESDLTVIPSVLHALITLKVSSHSSFSVLFNSIGFSHQHEWET